MFKLVDAENKGELDCLINGIRKYRFIRNENLYGNWCAYKLDKNMKPIGESIGNNKYRHDLAESLDLSENLNLQKSGIVA